MRIALLIALLAVKSLFAQPNYTPTYPELISAYTVLAEAYPKICRLEKAGLTDSGLPLHTLVINSNGQFNPSAQAGNLVYFLLNGIHPGEAAGINASLNFARSLCLAPPAGVTYVIVPVYNIGGALNRNSHTRANQNGPESYGFRGNAKNLDLNRDCIKADSKNALSFSRLFQDWSPHIFVDTHTSNGADYQATMTLISPFPERMHPMQRKFAEAEFIPALYRKMETRGQAMTPYVNTIHEIPDEGIAAFTDAPRYTTGYAALFNTLGFVTEAHMLKPFDDRVQATFDFLMVLNDFCLVKKELIVSLKSVANQALIESKSYRYNWKLTSEIDSMPFKGYQADTLTISTVTGKPSLRYRRDKPYGKNILHQHVHEAQSAVDIPEAYILPQAWTTVIERLDANKISYRRLKSDTTIAVTACKIESFKSMSRPYEGHFRHGEMATKRYQLKMNFRAGDIYIPTAQLGKAYLAQVFTPEAEDSFFRWNFFDSCLSQKEYYSDYVFDETAAEILQSNKALKKAFDEKKLAEPAFAANPKAQLDYIYAASPYAEPSAYRLPVYEVWN